MSNGYVPSQTARVFVGPVELVTPETQHAVEAAIARGDWAVTDRYRRFLGPILKRISAENPLKASQVEGFRRSMQESYGVRKCR
jgi:hypothetical protein